MEAKPDSQTREPPPPVHDVLDHLAYELRDHLADLWTLRDAIDLDLHGEARDVAVSVVARIGEDLADALDALRGLAEGQGQRLAIDTIGPPW